MSEENIKVVEGYIEQVINKLSLERFSDFCSDECIVHPQPYVGIGFNFDDTSGKQVILTEIAPMSPADGHLEIGDELVSVQDGGKTWDSFDDLSRSLWAHGVDGTELTLTVRRNGNIVSIPLKRGRIDGFKIKLSSILKTAIPFLRKYWPDIRMEIREIFGNDHMVACYAINSGTSLEYNRSATWAELDMFRLKDGKIVEVWGVENSYSQMRQLGYQIIEPVRVAV